MDVSWLKAAGDHVAFEQRSTSAPLKPLVGYFLRSQVALAHGSAAVRLPSWLAGHTVYRSVPTSFPGGMQYHYDGLASVLKFSFDNNGTLSWAQVPYESGAYKSFDRCLYVGSGTYHAGLEPCLANPGVNLLPMGKQLWMTIDNRFWGMVSMDDLKTPTELGIAPLVEAPTVTLNAHPACDYNGNGVCYVTYPCASSGVPGLAFH